MNIRKLGLLEISAQAYVYICMRTPAISLLPLSLPPKKKNNNKW